MTEQTAAAASTLALSETANIASAADLQVAISNLLETGPASPVEIDCSAVRSIDAAVLQCLIVNVRLAATGGNSLRCVRPSEDFLRIAAYVGLSGEFSPA